MVMFPCPAQVVTMIEHLQAEHAGKGGAEKVMSVPSYMVQEQRATDSRRFKTQEKVVA